jgi:hypothetical protein
MKFIINILNILKEWRKKQIKLHETNLILKEQGAVVFCPDCRNILNNRPAVGAVCGMYEYECDNCKLYAEFDWVNYPVPVLLRVDRGNGWQKWVTVILGIL